MAVPNVPNPNRKTIELKLLNIIDTTVLVEKITAKQINFVLENKYLVLKSLHKNYTIMICMIIYVGYYFDSELCWHNYHPEGRNMSTIYT